jgi:hypothetical protein
MYIINKVATLALEPTCDTRTFENARFSITLLSIATLFIIYNDCFLLSSIFIKKVEII